MPSMFCEIGVGLMSNKYTSIGKFTNRVSEYSSAYYIIIVFILVFAQFDIFKENVPIDHVINLVIVISLFTICSNMLNKALRRDKQDSKPFLYCPECPDAKMRTAGKWVCENCHKEFSDPKKEPNS